VAEEQNSQKERTDLQSPGRERAFVDQLFFSPGERRLRAGWRLAVQFILLAVFVLGIQFIIRYFLYTRFPRFADFRYYLTQLIILLGVTGSVYVVRMIVDDRSFQSLGLFLDAKAGRDFGVGVLIAFVMMGFMFLLGWAIGWVQFRGFVWSMNITSEFVLFWLVFFSLFLVVAWQEELLFRGYWLVNLREGLNTYWAVAISAVAYAALHFLNPNYDLRSLIYMAVMGVFLGFARVYSRRLWFPLGLHFGWKLFQGNVFSFRVGGLRAPGLILQQIRGPVLWRYLFCMDVHLP